MAENFQFQHTIPFKYWARSADTLYQEVRLCLCARKVSSKLTPSVR